MERWLLAILVLVLVLLVILTLARGARLLPRRVTVFEYERGLRYSGGRFTGVLAPGQYWVNPFSTVIVKVDLRPRFTVLTGQEVLSADGVGLRVALVAKYEVTDPALAVNSVQDFQTALYTEVQLALRQVVAGEKIEDLLAKRAELGPRLAALCAERALAMGLNLLSVEVRDTSFPGEMKRAFSQVVRARQEGLAALEKARGETAALRNLANAARLVEEKPALLQLRLLQQVGEGSGNTLVFGVPPGVSPAALGGKGETATPPPTSPPERGADEG